MSPLWFLNSKCSPAHQERPHDMSQHVDGQVPTQRLQLLTLAFHHNQTLSPMPRHLQQTQSASSKRSHAPRQTRRRRSLDHLHLLGILHPQGGSKRQGLVPAGIPLWRGFPTLPKLVLHRDTSVAAIAPKQVQVRSSQVVLSSSFLVGPVHKYPFVEDGVYFSGNASLRSSSSRRWTWALSTTLAP